LLQRAVALDPAFATAWAALSAVHAQSIFNNVDASPARLAKARAALETAQKLDPDNPEVIVGSGQLYYYALRDYPRALEYFERMTRQWPKFAYGHFMTGLVQRRQGRWAESLASLRRATELDPASAEEARNQVITWRTLRRYDEAIAEQTRRVRLLPESLRESLELARLHYQATGSTREGDAVLAGPIAERAGEANARGFRKAWAVITGDLATAVRLEREHPGEWSQLVQGAGTGPMQSALILAVAGDLPAARARLVTLPAELNTLLAEQPNNWVARSNLARAEAILGHKAEALDAARQALAGFSEVNDAVSGPSTRLTLIFALAWTGEKEEACTELRRLLAAPSNINVHEVKTNLAFTPLKGYPAFEAIVNDPKNNAPLF
jgi:tetratricopeptide (TPR) repeat protein